MCVNEEGESPFTRLFFLPNINAVTYIITKQQQNSSFALRDVFVVKRKASVCLSVISALSCYAGTLKHSYVADEDGATPRLLDGPHPNHPQEMMVEWGGRSILVSEPAPKATVG